MNRIAVRALELIVCRLRAMLQAYLFMHPAYLLEPSKTNSKPIYSTVSSQISHIFDVFSVHWSFGVPLRGGPQGWPPKIFNKNIKIVIFII